MAKQNKHSKQERPEPMQYTFNYEREAQFFQMESGIKSFLTPSPELISKDTDPLPRLQYISENIEELIRKKKDLKKKFEENPDESKYVRRYNKVRQEIRTRIRQHAAVLKWFDMLTESDQRGNKNHFTTSLDIPRVKSLIDYLRLHEDEPFFIASMIVTKEYTRELGTRRVLKNKSESIHLHYLWYAIYALYEDFVLAHPFFHDVFQFHHLERMLRNMEIKEQKKPKGSSWSHLVQKYNSRNQNSPK